MNGLGDFTFQRDRKNKHGSFGDIYPSEDLQIKPLISHEQRYKKNLLTNAAEISHVLERQSLVDCLEADEEYIISAGRDHNINVWGKGLCETLFVHLCRLSGHHAPVTGLCLFNSIQHSTSAYDKVIVSSSEDGNIKVWSLNYGKGKEISKVETGNVITCMGVINKSLAVVGNHKGYMEVYHLRSRDLYTSIRAHGDPIDALKVDGNYVCTAIFEKPSCLKVWDIQFEQTRCIYRIENAPEIEFCCLAIRDTKVILGASNRLKLSVIDFENDIRGSIILDERCGKVGSIKVQNEWIICSFTHKTEVFIDVHRFYNYEHFGTFLSAVKNVKAIAAIELDNSFKIIEGGSSLVLRNFGFSLTDEETTVPYRKFPDKSEKTGFTHKEKSNYTMKTAILDDFYEDSSYSDDSYSDNETFSNYEEKINCTLQSNFDESHFEQKNDESPSPLQRKTEKGSDIYSESRASIQQSNFDESHFEQKNDESPSPLQRKTEKGSDIYSESRASTQQSNFDESYFEQMNDESPLTLQRKTEKESATYSERRASTQQSNFDESPHFEQKNESPLTLERKTEKGSSIYSERKVSTQRSKFDGAHFEQENDENSLTFQRRTEKESSTYSESRVSTPQSNSSTYHQVNTQNEDDFKSKSTSSLRQTPMLSALSNENIKNKPTSPPRQTQVLSVLTALKREAYTYSDIRTISPTLDMKEPRIAMRKLEEELDNKHEEPENFTKYNKNVGEENDDVVIVKDMKPEGHTQKDMVEVIELVDDESYTEKTAVEDVELSKITECIKEEAEDLTTGESFTGKETQKGDNENFPDKNESSKKRNKKCKKDKKDKKKESQKPKQKKCEIM